MEWEVWFPAGTVVSKTHEYEGPRQAEVVGCCGDYFRCDTRVRLEVETYLVKPCKALVTMKETEPDRVAFQALRNRSRRSTGGRLIAKCLKPETARRVVKRTPHVSGLKPDRP